MQAPSHPPPPKRAASSLHNQPAARPGRYPSGCGKPELWLAGHRCSQRQLRSIIRRFPSTQLIGSSAAVGSFPSPGRRCRWLRAVPRLERRSSTWTRSYVDGDRHLAELDDRSAHGACPRRQASLAADVRPSIGIHNHRSISLGTFNPPERRRAAIVLPGEMRNRSFPQRDGVVAAVAEHGRRCHKFS